MATIIRCTCGKALKTPSRGEQTRWKCPSCGAPVELAAATKEVLPEEDLQAVEKYRQELAQSSHEIEKEKRLFEEFFFLHDLGYVEREGWHVAVLHPSRSKWEKSGHKEVPIDLLVGRVLTDGKRFIPLIVVSVRHDPGDSEESVLARALGQARVPAFEPHVPLVVTVYNGTRQMYDTYTSEPLPTILAPDEAIKRLTPNQQPEPISTIFAPYRQVLKVLLTLLPQHLTEFEDHPLAKGPSYREALLRRLGAHTEEELEAWQAHREVRRIFNATKHLIGVRLLEILLPHDSGYFPELRELEEILLESRSMISHFRRSARVRVANYFVWAAGAAIGSLLNVVGRPFMGIGLYGSLFFLSSVYFFFLRGPEPSLRRHVYRTFADAARGKEKARRDPFLVLAAFAAACFAITFLSAIARR